MPILLNGFTVLRGVGLEGKHGQPSMFSCRIVKKTQKRRLALSCIALVALRFRTLVHRYSNINCADKKRLTKY